MNFTTPEEHYRQVATRAYDYQFVALKAKDRNGLLYSFCNWAETAGFNLEQEPNGDFIDFGPQVCWQTWTILFEA